MLRTEQDQLICALSAKSPAGQMDGLPMISITIISNINN